MIKVVLDSNVYVSALLKPTGNQRKVIEAEIHTVSDENIYSR